jgi:hypothetical protein
MLALFALGVMSLFWTALVGAAIFEFSFRGNCGYESDFEYERPD